MQYIQLQVQDHINFVLTWKIGRIILRTHCTGWLEFLVTNSCIEFQRSQRLFILLFLPLINMLVLLRVNSRATKTLREAGYTVGFMGASK